MAKEEKAAQDEAPKKKSKLKLIIIAVVALLAIGGGAGYFFLKPTKAEAKPAPEPGAVLTLDAMTINLQDGHYLKLKMSLQLTADVGEEAPDGAKAMDLAISEYSNRPMAELFSNGERNKSKAELLEKIEKAYEDEVMDIYFTTFVIQ